MKRLFKLVVPTVLGLFLFSSVASAHVSVTPKTSTTGAWETYTVKVPVEKEVPTTKFTLKAPAGVEIMSYQPVPGWNYTSKKDSSGKVTAITFETTGQGILPGQFQQFTFVGKNPDKATKAAWDAFQYYKDGSVVEWTGDESSKSPHSITDIVSGAAEDHHDMKNMTQTEKKSENAAPKKEEKSDSLPIILSSTALLLSLVALVLAFRKK
jgi:uncharacterized protein YcnI